MKVQIRYKATGQIKPVEKRFADILVNRLKQAEYYDAAAQGTYQTKVMTAAPPVQATPPAPPMPPVPNLPVEEPKKPLESGAQSADNKTGETENPPKKKTTAKKSKPKVSTKEE